MIRRAVLALMIVLGLVGAACFVFMAGATSPAERAVDGACLLVVAFAIVAMSFLIWPRGGR